MSTSPPSRIANIAFRLWVTGGVVLAYASGHYSTELWSNYYADLVFGFVHPTPEQLARTATAVRLATVVERLAVGSVGYAILGVILFRRRGSAVFVFAVLICLLCWLGTCPSM
jgi:hypothetical protein